MIEPAAQTEHSVCRLCGGEVRFEFCTTILGTRTIDYFRCLHCESLQTETPFWIEDAYNSHLGAFDYGVVQRNITNQSICYLVSRLWGLKNALDFGGGDGLLCRMVRDHGINCYVLDKYGSATYAQNFVDPNFERPQMVFSFEVFEHFTNPKDELPQVFERGAEVIIASTGIYTDQREDWWYLSKRSGSHVFFYSLKAIHMIAERFGYVVYVRGWYFLFVKPSVAKASTWAAFKLMTRPIPLRLLRAFMAIKRAKGVAADAEWSKRLPAMR